MSQDELQAVLEKILGELKELRRERTEDRRDMKALRQEVAKHTGYVLKVLESTPPYGVKVGV